MNYTYNLGETLHSYIQKSGYSIYEISKKANISRSTLQKVLSNERKLTKNYLDKLKPFLKISPKEYLELSRMMEEIQKGIYDYRAYQLIKDLLLHINQSKEVYKDFRSFSMVISNAMERRDLYQGLPVVKALVHERLLREYGGSFPQMSVFIADESELLKEVLSKEILMYSASKNLTVKQIISFARDKSVAETLWQNVNALANVLPNIVMEKCHYEVSYYYGKDYSDIRGDFAFPYYIIFSDSVLLLSVDCTTGILLEEETVYTYFTNMFQSFLTNTIPLVTSCIGVDNILVHFTEAEKVGNPLFSLQSQPCLLEHLTKDMIEKYALVTIPFYDMAKEVIFNRCRQLKQYKLHNHTCYFSKAGLQDFAKSGYITDFPKEYAAPIDVSDRLMMLQALFEEISSERQNHRMINPHTFPIPDNLICVLHQDLGLDFYGFGLEEKSLNYIFITEPSILDLFHDFFLYIRDSMLLYTKEETLDFIRECMEQLS